MRRTFACWVVASLVAIAAHTPSVARADASSDAKDLFSRGRELRVKGNCATAVGLFRKAWEIYPAGLGSLRNLAECEETLGHFASSRRAWLDLKRALLTETAHKYDGWSQDADQAAARLAPKLATVTIDLTVVAPDGSTVDPKSVDVALDGEALAPALVGTPLDRDPGKHVVRVAGARVVGEPQQKAISLAAGDAKHVALRVVATPDKVETVAAPAPVAIEAPHDDAEAARMTRRTIGWASIGVGGALLVGAGVSLIVRQNAMDDVNSLCPKYTGCDPSLQSTVSRGQTATALFDVLGAIGIVGVGGGLALVLTNSPLSQQSGLVVTPHLGGVSAAWRF